MFQDEGDNKDIGTETLSRISREGKDEETEMFVISDIPSRDVTDIYLHYDKEGQTLGMISWSSDSQKDVSDEDLLKYTNELTTYSLLSVHVNLAAESKARPLQIHQFIHTNHYDEAWMVKEAIVYFSNSVKYLLGIDEEKEFYGDEWTHLEDPKEA